MQSSKIYVCVLVHLKGESNCAKFHSALTLCWTKCVDKLSNRCPFPSSSLTRLGPICVTMTAFSTVQALLSSVKTHMVMCT